MTTSFRLFWIAIIVLLLPSYAFAQAVIGDDTLELSPLDVGFFGNHGLSRSIEPVTNEITVDHGRAYTNGEMRSHLRARRFYHHNNTSNAPSQKAYYTAEPPVLEQQASAADNIAAPHDLDKNMGSVLGIGIRIVGFYPGSLTSSFDHGLSTFSGKTLHFKLSGGFGVYTKLRLIRWVSIESTIDLTYGKDKDSSAYLRIPISLGLQFHVFDYGMLDVYGVAAASICVVRSDSVGKTNIYKQYGGQFGAGLSVIFLPFELGLDMRYTVDTPPETLHTAYGSYYPSGNVQHGLVFAANLGLAF